MLRPLLNHDVTTSHSTRLPKVGSLVAGYPPQAGEGTFTFARRPRRKNMRCSARAKALMEAATEEDGARLSLAVVELGGEYFGNELQAVQEFCDIAQPSSIPCCPPHILGTINLRGDLLTRLDLSAALNLSSASQDSGKAVVAYLDKQMVGVAVDEVHDVIYLREETLQAAAAALREQHGSEVKGAAPYAGKMVALDLPALLAREEWIANESV